MPPFSTSTATPNLPVSAISFTAGSTTTIAAPASKVFAIITSFENYASWNTWCPSFTFPAGGTVTEGSEGSFVVRMEAQNREYRVPCRILELQRAPDRFVLAWKGMLLPAWAGTAERVQEVVPRADGGCEVRNWESMGGLACYVLRWMGVPAQLAASNEVYLGDLKRAAEGVGGEGAGVRGIEIGG